MKTSTATSRSIRLIGAGLLAASLFASLTACSADEAGPAAAAPGSATPSPTSIPADDAGSQWTELVRIIDGDTIEVQPINRQDSAITGDPFTVRILGADAPNDAECGAAASKAHLEGLMPARERIELTYEPALKQKVDEDGHTLAYATAGGGGMTQDIGNAMISDGFAEAAFPEEVAMTPMLEYTKEAGDRAVNGQIGIWAECTPKTPVAPSPSPTAP